MEQVMQDPTFDATDLMLEGALARLEAFELSARPSAASPRLVGSKPYLKRRKKHGIQFPFQPELEMRGIIHYLSTDGGTKPYENPHLLSVVSVSASSLERGIMLDLVSEVPSELWTKDVPASWVGIDFKVRE